MKKVLIKNGTIVTATDEFKGDLLLADGKIAAIGGAIDASSADEVYDAEGKYVMPGGVDQHTHFDFSFGDTTCVGWEGSPAAVVSGTTTIIDFVNQKVGSSLKASIDEYQKNKVDGNACCDYGYHGVVYDANDALFEEIEHMPEYGVTSLKLFMAYRGQPYHCDDDAVLKALQASKKSGVTIMVHAESADMIAAHLGDFRPEVLLVLGSGLGFLGDRVEARTCVSYADIPHFRASTAPGHEGRFVFGELRGKRVAVMQGRMHCYEGYTMEDASYACRVIRLLGAKTMIVTNAAGAVNTEYSAGDLMLISDHIKLFDFGPLWGPNIDEFGTRFPDMSNVYSPRLRELAKEVAREQDLTLREGVYMYFPGPQFETPAEVRAARVLGADAVGMSTVPEAIAAAHCGYEILGVTLCANMAAGVLPQPLSGEEVNEMAEQSAPHFSSLILGCLERL